ncbi:unnamed protein product [Cuscuta epithymum]|uniref:APO domain-containing protein n=1 Tax=Cuscuta epithymum TaxID=186058 RepID=A0AAV0DBE9_9ASTE|nr:unnamed protein product [Cuscuta epithymum]
MKLPSLQSITTFHMKIWTVFNIRGLIRGDYDTNFITKSMALQLIDASYSTITEVPRKLRRTERKPLVTSINELKRRERLEKQKRQEVREVTLKPPEDGLLVKGLIPVAHHVLASQAELLACVSRVADHIPIYSCRLCGEVHVGHTPHKIKTCSVSGSEKSKEHIWERGDVKHLLPLVESFHMYDRLGRAVSHDERLEVDRIPAIMELCIQAGVDVPDYPTRRRKFPVYQVARKMIDFEKRFPKDNALSRNHIQTSGFWGTTKRLITSNEKTLGLPPDDITGCAERGMEVWEDTRTGAIQLMQKYAVQTCGYCPEVQVGPKGHRVRQCQAFKHQMRDGQHAWQEATIDDLVPPVYVWHVLDPSSPLPLVDALKRYYGKLPAVVELFSQAGAQVHSSYSGVMRADIALPSLGEEKLVV